MITVRNFIILIFLTTFLCEVPSLMAMNELPCASGVSRERVCLAAAEGEFARTCSDIRVRIADIKSPTTVNEYVAVMKAFDVFNRQINVLRPAATTEATAYAFADVVEALDTKLARIKKDSVRVRFSSFSRWWACGEGESWSHALSVVGSCFVLVQVAAIKKIAQGACAVGDSFCTSTDIVVRGGLILAFVGLTVGGQYAIYRCQKAVASTTPSVSWNTMKNVVKTAICVGALWLVKRLFLG